ncbi:hypothetical protein M0804_007748 [Polistes exclamans]|nr:hypothetical protein M0804_007748 [Polistes exclamans]
MIGRWTNYDFVRVQTTTKTKTTTTTKTTMNDDITGSIPGDVDAAISLEQPSFHFVSELSFLPDRSRASQRG